MATTATGGGFQAARVISSATGTFSRNALTFGVLAFVLSVLPGLAYGLLFQPSLSSREPQAAYAVVTSPLFWLSALISVIGYLVLQAAVIYITVVDLDGRRPEFAGTISMALRCAVPLFGLSILFGLAIGIGFLLLIVPGVMLAAMWCVASASLVVERTGIIESFGRSRALTKGSRWPIFGIFFVLFLVDGVVRALVAAVVAGAFAASGTATFTAVETVVGAVAALAVSIVIAAIYVELRTAKEGASTTSLAAIFA